MTRLARSLAAILLSALPLAAVACGGKIVEGGPGPGPGSDGGVDSVVPPDGPFPPPPPPDTPGTCGSGVCSPGESCSPSYCVSCTCNSSGGWDCVTGFCVDSGPVCPPYIPKEGEPCSGSMTCPFTNECGLSAWAICDGSRWRIKSEYCPDAEPPPPPPPPPPECPKYEPKPYSGCKGEGLSCVWKNSCGSEDYGYCSGGTWYIKSPCTPPPPPPPPPPPTCPKSKPPSGTFCSPPSPTACSYPVSPGCTSYCFCADDYRWACISYGGGCGYADSGVGDVGWAETSPGGGSGGTPGP